MKYIFLAFYFFSVNFVFAQNELYIKGNDTINPTLYINGNDGTNPTIFINGEFVNNQGIVQNANGVLELTGNFTNTVSDTAKYESTGVEKFSNTSAVTISGTLNDSTSGTLNAVSSGINQFYNLKINSRKSTITLDNNVNVFEDGTVAFTDSGKIITSNFVLFVRNDDVTAISGYSFPASNTTDGSITNYIDGNLQRAVVTGAYDYPVGDGSKMIPFKLSNLTASGSVLGNVKTGTQTVDNSGIMYCDVATHPGSGSGQPLSANSSNAPDGIIDQLEVNLYSDVQWNANLASGAITTYDIEVFPGLHDVSGYFVSTLGNLHYLFKDGAPYSGGSIVANGSYPNAAFPATGFDGACPPSSPYILNGLSSFSNFRLGGVSPSGGTLPVELVYLEAYGVENKFIQVAWQTATEINNDGFQIQRSLDGANFENIGFVEGNGNSNANHNYTFDDLNVLKGKVYYYRLNQIDFNGEETLTYKVAASLDGAKITEVSPFIPNPSTAASHLEIQVSEATEALVVMYNGIGQLIMSEKVSLEKGLNVLPFNLNGYAAGIYQTSIKINEEIYSRKLNLTK